MGEKIYRVLMGKPEEKRQIKGTGVDRRITLIWIFRKSK
jgi:hypothetical protein